MSEVLLDRPAALTLARVLEQVRVPDGTVIARDGDGAGTSTREQPLTVLPVRAEAGWVLIGPAVLPGLPGCQECLSRRRRDNRPADGQQLTSNEPRMGHVAAAVLGALLADEVATGFSRTRLGVMRLCLRTGAVSRHRLIPDPLCPRCGNRPDDRPGRPWLAASPKPSPSVFRTRALPADLEDRYVDAETGLLGSTGVSVASELPTAVARRMPGRDGDESRHGYGRAFDADSAAAIAIVEALERHACMRPRGRRPVVRASYADVAEQAVDPRTLGLYPDSWYDKPGFRYQRFSPDTEATWIWGYSFAADRPVLVPLTVAYYGPAAPGEPRWAAETSNGAAIGGSLTEAVCYGLLEVAERDAFLMTWYGKLPAPRVDLSAAGPRIALLAAKVRQDFGYELMAFATAMEQGVPAFWAMAVDRDGGSGRPHMMCAAGAHFDPEQALRSALVELVPSVARLGERYDQAASAAMLTDSGLVTDMRHHRELYCHPAARRRLDFLPVGEPGRPLADFALGWPGHADLRADLAELVARYLATGLDVVAVDCTCPELAEGGFAAAKVLVPGTLPMTFGHAYRRIYGLPRLYTVPRVLGYTDRDLRADELNQDPHPFP